MTGVQGVQQFEEIFAHFLLLFSRLKWPLANLYARLRVPTLRRPQEEALKLMQPLQVDSNRCKSVLLDFE